LDNLQIEVDQIFVGEVTQFAAVGRYIGYYVRDEDEALLRRDDEA
jgi:hypothetical protein